MYAVIDIPRFALQSVLRMESGLRDVPMVLVDASLTKPLVVDCTRAARREGIAVGLSVSQAIGRCEEVAVRYCSAKAEDMASRVLFDCAYSLSPRVEETFPGVCTIGLEGVRRTGLAARCEAIVAALKSLDLSGRIGIAPTPDLALLAARESSGLMVVNGPQVGTDCQAVRDLESKFGPPGSRSLPLSAFLEGLPLAAAEPSEQLGSILGQWGIRSVGAFVDLPRKEVGRRLGTEGLVFWDRVSGREERPLRISELPVVYEESLEFEYEIDTLEPLLFLMRRFLDQLCLRMRVAHKVAEAIHLKMELADIRVDSGERVDAVELSLKAPEPTRDVAALFLMLATRLEEVETDSAVVALHLKIDPIDHDECQLGLFETSLKNPFRFTQTLARVAGIVGPESAGRPCLDESGRPDGVRMERLPSSVPPLEGEGSKVSFGLAMRRFRPPLAAEVEIRGRRPTWFRCSKASGTVVDFRGPWAFSGQWWDSEGWNRVEWDVELGTGGFYRLVKEKGRWWVEGVYD